MSISNIVTDTVNQHLDTIYTTMNEILTAAEARQLWNYWPIQLETLLSCLYCLDTYIT